MAIAITNLTSGADTTTNPSTTASISPANGSIVLVAFAASVEGGGNISSGDSATVSGCGLTWAEIGDSHKSDYGDRRRLYVFKGTGTPSSGSLTLTFNKGDGGATWAENAWSVEQVAGADETTPFGTSYPQYVTDTANTITVGETPDAGDFVYAAFRIESTGTSPALNSELSDQLALYDSGTDVRALLTAYDSSPDASPTPGITWTGTNGSDGIAFIVNVGGATQSNAPRAAHLMKLMGAM